MSMRFYLRALRPHEVMAILEDPAVARAYTYPVEQPHAQTVARLRELAAPASVLACLVPPPKALVPELSLGQAWHGVHWLLTGSVSDPGPASPDWAILGGREVGRDDAAGWGYGLPTLLDVPEVNVVATALLTLDLDVALGRLDGPVPHDVYLAEQWQDPAGRVWLGDALSAVVEYYAQARDHQHGMLRWLL